MQVSETAQDRSLSNRRKEHLCMFSERQMEVSNFLTVLQIFRVLQACAQQYRQKPALTEAHIFSP